MNENEQSIVKGALVQWTVSKICGVVTEIEGRTIRVRWDADGPPTQFAVGTPTLLRPNLQNQKVRLMSTGENAVALTPVGVVLPAWNCFVATGSGRSISVPEADPRPIPVTDPIERFQENMIGSLQQYRLQEVARYYRVSHLYDELVSLGQIGVDLKPHQVSVAHRVISNYPHRFLLCDEVGLGKTIEAGMALKELKARGAAQRVLAIVPPNLVRQWQFEMTTKFNEIFSVLNSATVQFLENQGNTGNPFTIEQNVLCSSAWISNPKWADMCAAVDWDLVIVDEAHHARSQRNGNRITRTRLYDLVQRLATIDHRRAMLFLTATPMQLATHELYALVELLDPALFPSEEHFDRHQKAVPGLSLLVERLQLSGFPLPDADMDEIAVQVAEWLELVDVDTARRRLFSSVEEREAVANELADRHLLSEVLIRNRKAVVGGFMPRTAFRWEVELTQEERAALQAVEDYVQYGFQFAERANNNAIGFVMVIFQKLMASSIAAIRESLGKRRERILANLRNQQPINELEERLEDDDNAGDVVTDSHVIAEMANDELSLLDLSVKALDQVKSDSKSRVLVEQLTRLFGEHPDNKVLIFTQFRETQRHLGKLLTGQGWGVNLFHGQMPPGDKDRAVGRFRDDDGSQILISTEAGGEGRNFQFCHLLVNYDLPWNPMKVEQRIGRVDRIGQNHAISIFNLWVKGTIEERVLDVLDNRIRVFEETVGGLDAILGETESDIRRIMRIAEEERDRVLEEFGDNIEEQVRRARYAEESLGDFIMDTKSYRKELAERIAGQPSPINNEDLDVFIGQLLADVRTYIKQTDDGYALTFHEDFTDAQRELFVAGRRRNASFRPDRRPDSQDVELMVFGHPVVDAIVEQVLGENYEGVTGTRRIIASEDLNPRAGWLFTYQFTTPGPRTTEDLVSVFVDDDGEVEADIGRRIVQRACRFEREEQEIDASDIPGNLQEVEPFANRFANEKREALQQQAENRAAGEVDREIARLQAMFDYREQVARDKMEATRATLTRIRESSDESSRQILPVWEANLRRDEELPGKLAEDRSKRMAEVERYRYPQVSWALKSLGRIEVVKVDP